MSKLGTALTILSAPNVQCMFVVPGVQLPLAFFQVSRTEHTEVQPDLANFFNMQRAPSKSCGMAQSRAHAIVLQKIIIWNTSNVVRA